MYDLLRLKELEAKAIQRLKSFEPETEPYYLCYSGGKDSDVIRILADLAGVKHDIVHNHTTVDAPETVYYVRSIPNIIIDYPKMSMWDLIVQKLMPPTRLARYCCSELKERGGQGRVKITGVRWAESNNRKESAGTVKIIGKPKTTQKYADEIGAEYHVNRQQGLIMNDDNDESRRMVEHCYRTTSTMINPIVDWSDDDVWEFLKYYGCKSNPLYECGFKRIGCIGCPLAAKNRYTEFRLYPKYKNNYIKSFNRMIAERKRRNLQVKQRNLQAKQQWESGEEVFKWWMQEDINQITFDDFWGD